MPRARPVSRLPDLPDETVEVEVEHRRGGDNREDEPLDRGRGDRLGHETQEAVPEHEAAIDENHRPSAAEEDAREPPGAAVARPAPVEGPDDGQVLHIVKDLEEGDPENGVGHRDRTPPPEPEGHRRRQQLHRVLAASGNQVPPGAEDERRGQSGERQIETGPEPEEPVRGEHRRPQRVPEFEQFAETARRVEDPVAEPAEAHRQVESGVPAPGGADPGVVDPQEPVHLERPVPDAPDQHDQRDAVQPVHPETERGGKENERREEEPVAEPPKERPVAIGPHHPGRWWPRAPKPATSRPTVTAASRPWTRRATGRIRTGVATSRSRSGSGPKTQSRLSARRRKGRPVALCLTSKRSRR